MCETRGNDNTAAQKIPKTKLKTFEVQFTPAKRTRFENDRTWAILTPPPVAEGVDEATLDNFGTASTHGRDH